MKHSILIVDDDELILNTISKHFASWDIEVYSAKDPATAKEMLVKFTPDIMLLDLLLTKEDGSQGILDFMRSTENLQHIPVLVLTNLDKPELKRMLLAQGVKEYIIKGTMTLDDLYKKVLGYLEPAPAETGNN